MICLNGLGLTLTFNGLATVNRTYVEYENAVGLSIPVNITNGFSDYIQRSTLRDLVGML